jgi:glutamate dehydrogenase (NAD(P)+)
MTLKNAAAGIPHGGAKSVIFADPAMPRADKERLIRAFACAIRDVTDYIPGPDMGTDEVAMAWVRDETGRAAGLPREVGGIPLDEIGSTGYGCAIAAEVAQDFTGIRLDGARVAVQGFGAVGYHAARYLAAKGARLVAASDSQGAIHCPRGIDVEALHALKRERQSVTAYATPGSVTELIESEDLIAVPCDIWIPAARPDVIRGDNVKRLKARLIVQGANIPATAEAEQAMHEAGILNIPDFIANAGGVITASVEVHGGSEQTAMSTIREKIAANTRTVLEDSRTHNILPRAAADALARRRVERAMSFRRWHT